MSATDANAVMDALEASLAAALPTRHVRRGLVDPANVDRAELLAGTVCLVGEGGGNFANYLGREGQLGKLRASLVGFVLVEEGTEAVAVERAELALLQELLGWTAYPNTPAGMTALPQEFRLSGQLEHPYGWLTLALSIEL